MAESPKYVWSFGLNPRSADPADRADGTGDMKDLLGGKGAGLAEMSRAGAPVPPGFTVTTEACRVYGGNGGKLPDAIESEIDEGLAKLERAIGKRLGDAKDPLLVSVRSGAKFSMPGMMDTILNLGLNDETVEGLAAVTGNARFAWDCYRRFLQMFGNVVFGIDKDHFEHALAKARKSAKVESDAELGADDLKKLVAAYAKIYQSTAGKPFPQDVKRQLSLARDAVFQSWNNPRAATYRNLNGIPHDLGTAVNVQAMVFGNTGDRSGTGVGFTRNPANGAKEFYGEFLQNAQGEDVVAGIRTPRPLVELESVLPEAYRELQAITQRLERHYRDMQDFEFTIQDGRLYMLQTRTGKRTGFAAVKVACDMIDEGLISEEEALMRIEPASLEQLLHPIFDPAARSKVIWDARGLPASPGAATGRVVFTADEAVSRAAQGWAVVLVRQETEPNDIHGMHVAKGFLTATGGMTSHAAVVGRQMGKPAVVGCHMLRIDFKKKTLTIGQKTVGEGDAISVDGSTGEVILGEVPTVPSEVIQVVSGRMKPEDSLTYQGFSRILSIADKYRRLKVRANADIPRDAKVAFAFGAQGIGLCRTEHMFFEEDRIPLVQAMILADTLEDREKALAKLLPLQRKDFEGLFEEMRGFAVTIRLIDPPLHEFLPKRSEVSKEIARLTGPDGKTPPKSKKQVEALQKLLERVDELHEFNPMLGHRGCRLGITFPEITRMQTRAIFEAACNVVARGIPVKPEIMVPLVGEVAELKNQRNLILAEASKVLAAKKVDLEFLVGTMIEVPRAAITADKIAGEAEFFSFGTNDLTQTTFGMSRDDSGSFLTEYVARGILPADPFAKLDREGVGELIKIAVAKGRATRPHLKIGICGEHGGEASSIEFCHQAGLDYVSASPFRVPIARLAAARAAISEASKRKSQQAPRELGAA
jgi:pyruvate,orthophosphate dikinase